MSDGVEVVRLEGPVRPARSRLAATRSVVAWWAASRLVVLVTVACMNVLHEPRGYFGPKILGSPLQVLGSWDGRWYRIVAERGYLLVPGHQSDPAFFPLYPVLLRIAERAGLPSIGAGVVISNLAFLVALLAYDKLGRAYLPAADARRATAFAAVFPLGYVFSMAYPESLVLALAALTGIAAIRGRWVMCAACVALATLARPEGIVLALPVAQLAIRRWSTLESAERGRALGAVLAAPAALVSFPLYLGWAIHDRNAWSKAQTAWGRSFRTDGLVAAVRELPPLAPGHGWLLRDAAFFVVASALIAVAWRAGVAPGWIIAGIAIILVPLASGSFESDGRFALLALPVYWGLAVVARRRWVAASLLATSTVLLALGTATLPLAFP